MTGSEKYGAQLRLEKRKKKMLSVHAKAAILYEEVFDETDSLQRSDQQRVLMRAKNIRDQIEIIFGREIDRSHALRHIYRLASRDFPEHKLKLKIVLSHSKMRSCGTQKDQNWFVEVRTSLSIFDEWNKSFEVFYNDPDQCSSDDLLWHLCMSAIFCGGIGSFVWLKSFISVVMVGLVQLIQIIDEKTSHYWVDLRTDDVSMPRNLRDEHGEVATRLWRVDATSLVLMNRVISCSNRSPASADLVIKDLAQRIETWLRLSCGHALTMEELCRSGVMYLEVVHALPASQPMLSSAMSDFSNACITLQDLVRLAYEPVDIGCFTPDLPPGAIRKHSSDSMCYVDEKQSLDKEFLGQLLKIVQSSDSPDRDLHLIIAQSTISGRSALAAWYLDLLCNRGLKTSSVATYHGALAMRWLAAVGYSNLETCDEARVNEIFEELFDDLPVMNRHYDYVLERGQDFFRFISHRYRWDFQMPRALTQRAGLPPFIRADVIPVWVVNAAVSYLLTSNSVADLEEHKNLALILILGHRTGLRISEILKIRLYDIEVSEAWWIAVRESEFGSNKTFSALRKVPLGALLTTSELDLFRDLVSFRKSFFGGQNPKRVLLFGVNGTPSGLFDQGYVSKYVSDLLSQIFGRRVVFHSLRHTALTALEVIMSGDNDKFARTITGYSSDQILLIRKRIFGARDYLCYWQLAGIAGHIDPKATLENYMHATSLLFYRIMARFEKPVDSLLVRNIGGVSKTLITQRAGSNASISGLDYDAVCRVLSKKIEPLISNRITLVTSADPVDPIPSNIRTRYRSDVLTCYLALRYIEKRATVQEAAINAFTSQKHVTRWVNGARRILDRYQTVRGRSRLIDSDRTTDRRLILTPGLPNSQVELSEALEAIVAFREVYQSDRQLLFWATDYLLSRVSVENTGLRFSSIDDLARFLGLLTRYYPVVRFLVILHPLRSADATASLKKWSAAYPGLNCRIGAQTVVNSSLYPDGRALLMLRHPDEEALLLRVSQTERQYGKFASHALKFIFHMLSIMMPDPAAGD